MLHWIETALGLWLIISPWLLGFKDISLAKWDAVIVGIVVFVSGMWSIYLNKSKEQ